MLPLEATSSIGTDAEDDACAGHLGDADLHTTDFLRLTRHPAPLAAAEEALRAYGCGTCGRVT